MKQKTLYTCEVCHTDYTDPDKDTDIEVVNGVFCDTLQENFTRVTGLATHL